MSPTDPGTWSAWTWALLGLSVYYTVDFFLHFARFRRLERAALRGDLGAARQFNRAIRGFPHSGFAKMLGKRPIVEAAKPQGVQPVQKTSD